MSDNFYITVKKIFREINVTVGADKRPRGVLDRIESIAKIGSLLAIPVLRFCGACRSPARFYCAGVVLFNLRRRNSIAQSAAIVSRSLMM